MLYGQLLTPFEIFSPKGWRLGHHITCICPLVSYDALNFNSGGGYHEIEIISEKKNHFSFDLSTIYRTTKLPPGHRHHRNFFASVLLHDFWLTWRSWPPSIVSRLHMYRLYSMMCSHPITSFQVQRKRKTKLLEATCIAILYTRIPLCHSKYKIIFMGLVLSFYNARSHQWHTFSMSLTQSSTFLQYSYCHCHPSFQSFSLSLKYKWSEC